MLKVVGILEDRSELSDAMTELCEELPIYVVVEREVDSITAVQPQKTEPAKRKWKQLIDCGSMLIIIIDLYHLVYDLALQHVWLI